MTQYDATQFFENTPDGLREEIEGVFNHALGFAMMRDVYRDMGKKPASDKNASLSSWKRFRSPTIHNAIRAIASVDFEFSELPTWRYCYLSAGAMAVAHYVEKHRPDIGLKPNVADILLIYLALRCDHLDYIRQHGQTEAIDRLRSLFSHAATKVNEAGAIPLAVDPEKANTANEVEQWGFVDPESFTDKDDSQIQVHLGQSLEPWLVVESCTSFNLKLVPETLEEERYATDEAESVGGGATSNS